MSSNSEGGFHSPGWLRYFASPTVLFSIILIVIYVITCSLVGDFNDPLGAAQALLAKGDAGLAPHIVLFLAQYQDPGPVIPTSLITSMFLHASILHIASNVLFLLFFGFILEEHVTKTKWVATFLLTGFVGNITFAIAGIASLLPSPSLGVGASGAVYGIMATALGWRATILVIFLAGLDLFAGGGFFAHFGGLLTGFVLRHFWISRNSDDTI